MSKTINRYVWWACLCLLLILTFFLRTHGLTQVPPGLTHDEASNAHDASAVLAGHHALYFPVGYGHEPLFNYSVALLTRVLGESIYTLRFTSVLWSFVTMMMTVALSRRWMGRRAALLTGAALAASFWAQMMGRVGLRGPVLPALFTTSLLFYDRAMKSNRRLSFHFVVSGFFLGASFYTYMASRGLPAVYAVFLFSLFIVNRRLFQKVWRGTAVTLFTAALTGSPLFIYLYIHPELEQRVAQLGGAITAFFQGNWQPLLKNITDSLPMMLWQADPRWLYNISGRAALEPFFALLFVTGSIVSLMQWRKDHCRMMLIWLGGGAAPALLTRVEYNTLHAIAAMPAAFLLVTVGLDTVLTLIPTRESIVMVDADRHAVSRDRKGKNWRVLVYLGVILMYTLTGIESMNAYFNLWGQQRDVHVAYHHHVVRLGRELLNSGDTSPVVITSLYPGQFHDPYTMDITLGEKTLPLKWADGRSAVFVPGTASRLYVEEQTQLPAELWKYIEPDITPLGNLVFRPEDIPGITHGYHWDSATTWDRVIASLNLAGGNPNTREGSALEPTELQTPINLGDVILFHGYRIIQMPLTSEKIQLLTAWSVLHPVADELKIFVHLTDDKGAIVSQEDSLGAPSWQWENGDRFIHLHQLTFPAGTGSSSYTIATGLYNQADYSRIPLVGQNSEMDHITILIQQKDL